MAAECRGSDARFDVAVRRAHVGSEGDRRRDHRRRRWGGIRAFRCGRRPERPDAGAGDAQCFAYDGQRRLTQAWTPANGDCAAAPSTTALGGAAPYWFTDTFDQVGNRTTRVSHEASGDTTYSYAFPAAGGAGAHQLSGVTAVGPDGTSTSAYGYDAAGNTVTRDLGDAPAETLTWDPEGELASVSDGSSTDTFLYTADGDRLIRRQGGTTTVYLPGGEELTLTGGQVKATRYYTFNGATVAVRTAPGTSGVSTLVSDTHATAHIAIANTSRAVTRRYTDPYGNARGAAPQAWAGDHGFLNKPVDDTGLVQVGARYYDPVIARFITVDPVMDLTDPQQWNAYTYANGNPVTWADPTGKWPDWLDDAASAVGDGISGAWDSTTTWVDEHQADIVAGVAGAVVGGGCLLLTAGAGSIACGALGGAAVGAASHAWRAQVQHTEEFSWGSMGRNALIGGVIGGATAGIGNALRPLTNPATTAIGGRISAASSRISPYLGRPPTATLPRPSQPHVFFSGGTRVAANEWAAANGGRTINMTLTGRALGQLERAGVPYRYTKPLWNAASARFARGATGEAHVFLGPTTPLRNSIFFRTELPILRQNAVNLVQHGGWTRV